jgi:hypothetical protein
MPPYGYGQGPQPPKKPNTGLIVAIVLAAVVLLGGGTTAALLLLGGDSDESSPAPDQPRAAAPPKAVPDKYTSVPTCQDVAAAMPGLPPLQTGTAQSGPKENYPSELLLKCSFLSGSSGHGKRDQTVSVTLTVYLTEKGSYRSGTEEAAGSFEAAIRNGGEEVTGLGFGERAVWPDQAIELPDNALVSCPLEILDGNAILKVRRSGALDPASQTEDRTSPTCREPTKQLTQQIHQAVLGIR